MTQFLSTGRFIDSDSQAVIQFARDITAGAGDDLERALRLYRAVRDGITYDPYVDFGNPSNYKASGVLASRRAFCIGKAALLAASLRVVGIPSRVGYADVRNHLTSPRLYDLIKTDIFLWHSYAEVLLNDRWLKATPAFDLALCEKLGLKPLDFDGKSDSLFHPFDRAGRRHMEYLNERGSFADVPFETILADFRATYPMLLSNAGLKGDFRSEAVAASEG